MTKFCLLLILSLAFLISKGQFFDNFSDGDYFTNPSWSSNTEDFIINNNLQLQSGNTIANSTFSITTISTLSMNAQWEFWVRLDFNTSSANYVDVWLTSSGKALDDNTNAGYYVRLGSTDDNISLFKKSGGGNAEKLIEGVKGVLNSSSSTFKIKVIRMSNGKWILLRDMTGTGNSYRSEGEMIDKDIVTSSYFGILIRQSTASFFQKHFFDDLEVKEATDIPSSQKVQSVKVLDAGTVQVTFQNPVNILSAENVSRYHVNTVGSPLSATVDAFNGSIVYLKFGQQLKQNEKNTLIVDEVADVYGNMIAGGLADFYYYNAKRYDVVINEVFADPSPQIGLPAQKFIELKNNATFPVNLSGWQLKDAGNTATLPPIEILPDSFLIVTTSGGLNAYKLYGNTVSVANFPSLNISGGQVSLLNHEGSLIHSMGYNLDSYKNEVKKEGGYSLEIINSKYGCGDTENWTASNDISGGTPGRENSVNGYEFPKQPIKALRSWLKGTDTLWVKFSKTIDSSLAVQKSNFVISDGISIKNIELPAPSFNLLQIILEGSPDSGKVYTISIKGITDCAGNEMSGQNTVKFGIPAIPSEKNIIVNEILSDPKTSGAEFVEFYNQSDKIFDISRLFIANRNSAGNPSSVTRIYNEPYLFFPNDFLVITKDTEATIRDFPYSNPSSIVKMNSLPSFPNDKGFVLLLEQQGNIIDEINYDKSWHFSLINNKKGISLERISYDGPSDKTNFHSASKDMGYGTPGIKNSQHRNFENPDGTFSITPKVFSPDNDGVDDFVTLNYDFKMPGYVANVKIFDASGRLVRYLEKNSLSGIKGYYRWDGLDDKNQKLPQGIYVIYFEAFNENGKKVVHKKTVVLARR